MPKVTDALKNFVCACGKSYAHAPNLTRHKKTCNHTTESTKTITQTDEITELKAHIVRMEKKLDALTAYIMKKETNAYDITQPIIENVEEIEEIEEVEEVEDVIDDIVTDVVKVEKKPKAQKLPKAPVAPTPPKPEKLPKLGKKAHKQNDEDDEYKEIVETHATNATIATDATDFKTICRTHIADGKVIPKNIMVGYAYEGKEGYKKLLTRVLTSNPKIFQIVPFKLTGDLIPLKGEKPINVFSVGVFEDHIQVCKSKKWSKMTRDDTCQFFYNLWIAMVDNYHHDENHEDFDYETHELYNNDIDDINIYSMLIADMKVEILDIIKEFS